VEAAHECGLKNGVESERPEGLIERKAFLKPFLPYGMNGTFDRYFSDLALSMGVCRYFSEASKGTCTLE